MQITTTGIDLAKTVFQLHAVDADGATVLRKRLRRAEVLSFFAGLEPRPVISLNSSAIPRSAHMREQHRRY